KTGDLIIFVEV
ncbi:unnamed protein product, partial [Allacma fusca]